MSALEEDCSSSNETYEKIIEYIFCTKNIDENFFKSYPRAEIIYATTVASQKILAKLHKCLLALKDEDFEIRQHYNDELGFIEAKFDMFTRQLRVTEENFRVYRGWLKINEIELKRLHEKLLYILESFAIKEKCKRQLTDMLVFLGKQLKKIPSSHPLADRAPQDSNIEIEYVTVRKLLEKLTECHDTIMAEDLLDIVIFSYDHFLTPLNLLLFLIKKYYTPRPLLMTFVEYRGFKDHQSATTKQRILDIICFWVTERQGDFKRNPELTKLLTTFTESIQQLEKETVQKQTFARICERLEAISQSNNNQRKLDKCCPKIFRMPEYETESDQSKHFRSSQPA